MNKPKVNMAVVILTSLRAYKPKVTVQDELTFTLERLRAKRRTRPMAGRGSWGKFLKEHFDRKAFEAKQRKAYA